MELTQYEDVKFPKHVAPNPEKNLEFVRTMEHREGDILICTYPKCGSHWTESLIRCLLRKDPNEDILSKSSLIDLTPPEVIKALPSPRIVFTHLLPNRMPEEHVKGRGKMILVLRNPKDVAVSLYHHLRRSVVIANKQSWAEFFESFVTGDVPFGDVFTYLQVWQDALKADKFDIECLHFEDLKLNPLESIKRLVKHLGVSKTDEELKAVIEECSFGSLKSKVNPDTIPPALKDNNNEMVIYRKGDVGDWKNMFTVAQNERFDRLIEENMNNLSFRYEP